MALKFGVVAPMSSADGYGYSAELLVLAAKELGADIAFKSHDWKEPNYTDERLLALEVDNYDYNGVLVVYFIPYAFHHFRAAFQIGQTMFETTEIPDVWAQFCAIPKALIVPSKFCKEVFQKKVNKPIEVVPLGVDPNTYYYIDREESSIFTFLMAGLLHYRKGADIAVQAYKEEFKESEPTRLVLKTRKNFLDIGDQSLRDDIEVVNYSYSRAEMLDLYHAADCFLAPSRGEASGLTPREALATGLPTIVTDWGGLKEIADEQYTYPIEIEGLEEAPITCSSYSWGITQGQSIGSFCRPSVEHLRKRMREVYEDSLSKDKGKLAAEWINNNWSAIKCGEKWLESIERLSDEEI